MLKIILGALALFIIAVLVLAARKPDVFKVERSIRIKAPAAAIFANINDFQRWQAWSPYETKDPAMQRSYGAKTGGVGATYGWRGNKEVGVGHMEIDESSPPSKVGIELYFEEPFKAHNHADFSITPNGDSHTVTWAMQGPTPFIGKIMHVFFNMDRMVGADFEVGLVKLKTLSEQQSLSATGAMP